MSLRDDLARVAHDWLPGDLEANTAISLAEGFADAAHAAVRSHVNRLADRDALKAVIYESLRATLEHETADWKLDGSAQYAALVIARHIRSLCEEQTEGER